MSGIRSRLHKKHEIVRLMHKHGYHPWLTASEKHLTYVLSEFLKSKNHKYINFKYGNHSSDLINGEYVFDEYYDEFNDWLKVFKPKHDIYVDKLYKTTWSKKHYNHLNKLKNKKVNKQVLLVFGVKCKEFGTGCDTTNWQNSAIDRE